MSAAQDGDSVARVQPTLQTSPDVSHFQSRHDASNASRARLPELARLKLQMSLTKRKHSTVERKLSNLDELQSQDNVVDLNLLL